MPWDEVEKDIKDSGGLEGLNMQIEQIRKLLDKY
jgi:hypothetical protein